MKYLCIKNTQADNDGSKWFTVGKWYDVVCEEYRYSPNNSKNWHNYYMAISNIGNKVTLGEDEEFLNEHFMSIVEYRLKKLKEL